jgi:L-lactate dehydrogenase complex protein LldG
MNSRDQIINSIHSNKPTYFDLPLIDIYQVTTYENLTTQFIAVLKSIGGDIIELENFTEFESIIANENKTNKIIINAMDDGDKLNAHQNASELESVYKAYIKASIGVAENGAVWINESRMTNRLLPFICQHLIVVLEKEKIVATMHQAYQQINAFEEGFGVFVAGPSKTADIEQSLVIGAHGARSMTVCLV